MAECVVSEASKDSSKQSSDVQSSQDVKTEKVMEPLLLEDFQRNKAIPASLSNLMKVFEKQGLTPSKTDFLVGCIYIFMLEYGFIPQDKGNCYEDCGFNCKRVKELASSPGWRKCDENSYSLSFILAPHSLYICNVLCIRTGDDLIINANVKNIEDVHCTLMLDILSYFIDGAQTDADLSRVQNMRCLSTLFKSHIAFPIKHAILRTTCVRHPCFEDLPLEIIFYIFKYFHGTDIVKFTAVSKQFHLMRQEPKFWENLIMRDYEYPVPKNHSYGELMKEYGRLYRLQLKRRREESWKKKLIILQCV